MRNFLIGAALAAAALFGALAPQTASAQYAVDPGIVFEGAAELQAPLPAAGAEYASPAAPDGRVIVPYGSWIDGLLANLQSLVITAAAAAFAWLSRFLPGEIAGVIRALRVEQALEKAVQYGVNATRGAVRDKVLSVQIGNEVLERGFEYALRHAPRLVESMGGAEFLREKIIARLNLDEDAAVPTPRPAAEYLVATSERQAA